MNTLFKPFVLLGRLLTANGGICMQHCVLTGALAGFFYMLAIHQFQSILPLDVLTAIAVGTLLIATLVGMLIFGGWLRYNLLPVLGYLLLSSILVIVATLAVAGQLPLNGGRIVFFLLGLAIGFLIGKVFCKKCNPS